MKQPCWTYCKKVIFKVWVFHPCIAYKTDCNYLNIN